MIRPEVSVVVLAYGSDEVLDECVKSVLCSEGVDIQLVVVNNGSKAIECVPREDSRVTLVDPGYNTGFSGGCNLGASLARFPNLVFLNSDAVVESVAISKLVKVIQDPRVGIAAGAVLLGDRPELMMSAGNPIHFLFFTWTGSYGDQYLDHLSETQIAGTPGSFFAIRREVWDELDGFEEEFFAFAEDANISIKCWQMGLSVLYVPQARALHFYEFSRVREKMYLVEKNRLINLLTLYDLSSLLLLAPAILAVEAGVLVLSIKGGWAGQKIRGWFWVIRNFAFIKRSRRKNRSRKSDTTWTRVVNDSLNVPIDLGFQAPEFVNRALKFYFQIVSKRLN
jgi:GT2 family glycosyltransferase